MAEEKKSRTQRAIVIIISGPSGVGKSTICRELMQRLPRAYLSVSVTTRDKGKNETDGKDYWFISREEFDRRVKEDLLLEYADVFGNCYGTPRDKVDQALALGKSVILEIDVQGARQVKEKRPDALTIFILPPTQGHLARRIGGRGRDNEATVQKRLAMAENEIEQAKKFYEYMVVNDDLQDAVDEIMRIINKRIGDIK
jgi:guanylate kinase